MSLLVLNNAIADVTQLMGHAEIFPSTLEQTGPWLPRAEAGGGEVGSRPAR